MTRQRTILVIIGTTLIHASHSLAICRKDLSKTRACPDHNRRQQSWYDHLHTLFQWFRDKVDKVFLHDKSLYKHGHRVVGSHILSNMVDRILDDRNDLESTGDDNDLVSHIDKDILDRGTFDTLYKAPPSSIFHTHIQL